MAGARENRTMGSDLLSHEELRQRDEQRSDPHDQAACADDFWPVKPGSKVANECYN